MYVLSVQYSCAVVSVFLFGGKAFLVLLTLFYSTLLALTDRQTDGRTDRETNLSWLCWPHPDGFLQVYPGCAGRTLTGSSRLILVVLAAP